MDRLAIHAAEAKKLGISYGQYMAMRYEAQQAAIAAEERERRERKARKAAEKLELEAARKTEEANWVSVPVESAKDGKKRIYKVTTRRCAWCGKLFQGKGTQKFCCDACKIAKGKQNMRESRLRQRERRAAAVAASGARYDLIWKKCIHCGNAFLGTRGQTICSDACRAARRKAHASAASKRYAQKKKNGEP